MTERESAKCSLCNGRLYFLWRMPAGDLFKCKYCGSEFINAKPEEIKYDQSFFRSYFNNSSSNIEDVKERNFRSFLNENFSVKDKKILDIGCGPGLLLRVAKALGAGDCYGLDVSEWVISQARENTPECKFYCGNLAEAVSSKLLEENSFDIIIGADVIEHIVDFKTFLQYALKLLRNEGKMIFTTPNLASLSRLFLGRFWFHYQNEHFTFVSSVAFKILARDLGIRIDKIVSCRKKLPLGYIFSILGHHTGGLTRRFGRIGLSIVNSFAIKDVTIGLRTGELLIRISKP